jgi:hypothetical protein
MVLRPSLFLEADITCIPFKVPGYKDKSCSQITSICIGINKPIWFCSIYTVIPAGVDAPIRWS